MRWPSGGTTKPIGDCAEVSGTAMLVRSSTSDLPRLEIDARIDPGIGEVGDQIHHQCDERQDIEVGEHDGIIAIEHALEAQEAKAIKRKNRLDQQRAGKKNMHE